AEVFARMTTEHGWVQHRRWPPAQVRLTATAVSRLRGGGGFGEVSSRKARLLGVSGVGKGRLDVEGQVWGRALTFSDGGGWGGDKRPWRGRASEHLQHSCIRPSRYLDAVGLENRAVLLSHACVLRPY